MVQTARKPTITNIQRYLEMRERVATFTDKLGTPLDPGIEETVIALNLLGLQTVQSCEGHLDHGCPYPWVTVINREHSRRFTKVWSQVCALEEEAKQTATEQAYDYYLAADSALRLHLSQWKRDDTLFPRLIGLLDTYYAGREETPVRLMVLRLHPGLCRIEPGWSHLAKELPESLKARYLERSQTEMQAFTGYLMEQWQQEQTIERETMTM